MSVFTISLDFELHWGGFEKWPLDAYRQYFKNTRETIPRMLDLFERYEVHVTWAAVGLLFHESFEQIQEDMPTIRPSYTRQEFSAYHYISTKGIGAGEKADLFHYGFSLLKKIQATPHQEIGSHTFAHYYCNEPGQTLEQFRYDLKAAQKSAARLGLRLQSLVFPRNQFNGDYLKVCYEEGFTAVRSNPSDWFWNIQSVEDESFFKRLNRGADAYLNLGSRKSVPLTSITRDSNGPLCIPASRLLRPYRPSELFLNRMKINRIKQELKAAAEHGELYHLWWHPHNFGNYPAESLRHLEEILNCYRTLHEAQGMKSMTMMELTHTLTA